jgi:hypothetical protein
MDYDSEPNISSDFNNLKKTVYQLSAEQKVELIKDISKQLEAPMNADLVMQINHADLVMQINHADLVMQVNSGDSSLDELFLAAANLIARRRKDKEESQPPTQI